MKQLFGILIAVAAIAGIGYFLLQELRPPGTSGTAPDAPPSAVERPAPSQARGMTPAAETPARRATGRTDTILTCTAADGQVYYTNATRCEDADLDNRINVVDMPELPASRSRPTGCLGAQAGGAALQQFLPVCREPFQAALEQERFLLELEDPLGSPALRRYCASITEGVQAGCMATSDQFCFLPRCQELRETLQQ
ncbi:MAG: hypothetical protein V2I57_00210 [Xanthomonadales bacterium]|jgi:hypothetical protein|nr:hypothetical protein [Xanthomonadales bacterium]